MSHLALEGLPLEILLQICELLQDTHPASTRSFSKTNHTVRSIANKVIFRNVILPIHSPKNVKEDVQQLSDALGPISALGYIRSLRVCFALDHTSVRHKAHLEASFCVRSDNMLGPIRLMNDRDWVSLADLLKRCSALSDLLFELRDQLAPCVLHTLHRYHPRCRLHMRAFSVKSLMTSEPDTHELAIASSPCLHSIWFTYMEPEEDAYASRSQRVIQQVLAGLAPNVEEIHFWRTRFSDPGRPGWQDTRLPMEMDSRS